jgi:hypothetical protein
MATSWYLTSAEGCLARAVAPPADPDTGETACGAARGVPCRPCGRPAGHPGAHAAYNDSDGAIDAAWTAHTRRPPVTLAATLAALVPASTSAPVPACDVCGELADHVIRAIEPDPETGYLDELALCDAHLQVAWRGAGGTDR